jgi:hypothetical protein
VSSTDNYRKELGIMEEERKKGTLTPQNQAYFSKQVNTWMSNSELSETFNGKYIEYFDVDKFTRETFDAVKPSGLTYDEIYITGNDGKPLLDKNKQPVLSHYMKTLEKEGRFPETVKNTLNQIFSDPRVSRQLNITGQYNLSSMDDVQLKQKVQLKKENDIEKYQDTLINLKLKEAAGINVSEEIGKVQDNLDKINSSYDELLNTNDLDSLRGTLYKQDTYDRYTSMFSQMKTKESIGASPAFDAEFKINNEAQRRAEKAFDQKLEVTKYERGILESDRNYDLEVFKAQTAAGTKKGKVKGSPSDPPGGKGSEGPYSTEDMMYNSLGDSKYTSAANNYSSAQDEFIWKTLFSGNPKEQKKYEELKYSGENYSDKRIFNMLLKQKAAEKKIDISQFRQNVMKDFDNILNSKDTNIKLAPAKLKMLENIKATRQKFLVESARKEKRDEVALEGIKEIGLSKEFADIKPELVEYRGQKIALSKQNQIDIATYLAGTTNITQAFDDGAIYDAGRLAKKNLDKAGLGELAERYLQNARMGNIGLITGTVGRVSEAASGLKDLYYAATGRSSNTTRMALKLETLGDRLKDKSYGKVVKSIANVVRQQYNINPNISYSLSVGSTEEKDAVRTNLAKYYSDFTTEGSSQNLATKEQFENFAIALNDKESMFFMKPRTDEGGFPVYQVESRDSNGNVGKMVLTPSQAKEQGYDVADIFEPESVSFLRERINNYGGKTSVQEPSQTATYKDGNNDYVLDNYAGNFPRIKNKNYIVRANIEQVGASYYPYVYVSDGKTEKVKAIDGYDDLSKVYETLSNLNDSFVISVLNNK